MSLETRARSSAQADARFFSIGADAIRRRTKGSNTNANILWVHTPYTVLATPPSRCKGFCQGSWGYRYIARCVL